MRNPEIWLKFSKWTGCKPSRPISVRRHLRVSIFEQHGRSFIMRYTPIFLALSLLLTGCGRDAMLTKEIPGAWQREGKDTHGNTCTITMSIAPNNTFAYSRVWNEHPFTNTFAGTWRIEGGFLLLTLTNRSGPNPNIPAGVTPIKSRIVHLDKDQLIEEIDGKTNISSR
jgi:hypothetical protein